MTSEAAQKDENVEARPDSYERDVVVRIINSVITKVQDADMTTKSALSCQLHLLRDLINDARQDIGAVRPGDIKGVHIPAATDELDAVVGATEEATGIIMDACEEIQQQMGGIGSDAAAAIEAETIKIFEACSFQDITGQRITKVVRTLQTIDEKVGQIIEVLENKIPGIEDDGSPHQDDREGLDALLNGPQLPERAVTQDDIDRLLAELEN